MLLLTNGHGKQMYLFFAAYFIGSTVKSYRFGLKTNNENMRIDLYTYVNVSEASLFLWVF